MVKREDFIRMAKADIVLGIIFAALSIVFYIGTLSFPKFSIGINPKVYPLIIIISTFALSVTLMVQGILRLRKEKMPPAALKASAEKSSSEPSSPELTLPRGKTALKLIVLAIGMLAYVIGFEPLGYIIVTPLLMALTMYLFGERKPFRIIAVSVLVSVILYGVFRTVFRVPLPRSIIW